MPFISSIRRNHDFVKNNNNDFEITGGDSVFTAGGYRIHTFTTAGKAELLIKNLKNDSRFANLTGGVEVEYLVVAGGGAGSGGLGGGGGAGGFKTGTVGLSAGAVPINVGAGVAGSPGGSSRPRANINTGDATNDSMLGPITCTRGGAAGRHREPTAETFGLPGGSGGGGGCNGYGAGGDGIIGQGYPGGHGSPGPGNYGGGGGGGASERGGNNYDNSYPGLKGGNGMISAIDGLAYVYAGGGGGGCHSPAEPAGSGGLGGGGGGAADAGTPGSGGAGRNSGAPAPGPGRADGGPGGTNTGGGGGGGDWDQTTGGSGGPGIVIVRYRV